MKNLVRNSDKGLTVLTILIMVAFFVSCGGGPNREAQRKLDETRQQTVANINKIKNDIDSRISYVDEEIKTATGEVKVRLQEARTKLEEQKDILAMELEKINKATLETWNESVKKASEATTKVRSKTNEVSKTVREMLDSIQ